MSISTYDSLYAEYPPYESTPMKAMYERIAKMIPRLAPVVDLGCGNGYLASALKERNYAGNYTGYDFSPVAVEMAEVALSDQQMKLWSDDTQYNFIVQDLNLWEPEISGRTHQTVYVCCEVLEHYLCDVTLVNKLPARCRFIFSVPNYWSQTHIRTYDSIGAACNKYGHALKFAAWYIMPTKQPEAAIHLYDSFRRSDKW